MTYSGNGHWGQHWDQGQPSHRPPTDSRTNRTPWVIAVVVLVAALVAAAAVIGYLVVGDNRDTPSPAAAEQPEPSPAPVPTPTVEESDDDPAAADSAPTGPCDERIMARDLDREISQVNVVECRGDWAFVSVIPENHSGPVGDPMYITRRVDGGWTNYVSIPSSECLDDAVAEGMPIEWGIGGMATNCGSESSSEGTSGAPDLGLSTSISRPACDDRGIVILHSAVTPGQYAQEVGAALSANPGASYLRTDHSCPSLRQRDDNGNLIYAVYRLSGYTQAEVCADVAAAGGQAYGRWLSNTRSATDLVTC